MIAQRMAGSRRHRHERRGESAQALVEFSIVASLFILLALGIVNFGVVYERQMVLTTAADNGARFASTHSWYLTDSNNVYNASTSSFAQQSACGASYTSCPSQTIEGVIQSTSPAGTSNVSIPDTDTNIVIRYYCGAGTPTVGCGSGSSTPVLCGTFTTATATWTYAGGYTAYSPSNNGSSACGAPGGIVDVKVSLTSGFALPVLADLFANGITQSSDQQTVIEQ